MYIAFTSVSNVSSASGDSFLLSIVIPSDLYTFYSTHLATGTYHPRKEIKMPTPFAFGLETGWLRSC